MFVRRISGAVAVFLAVTAPGSAADPKIDKASPPLKASKVDANDLSLEIAALQTMRQLRLDKAQLEALGKLAQEVAPDDRKRTAAQVSDSYRRALVALRDALRANDADRIEGRSAALDDLHDKEEPELDDGVQIAAAARSKALEYLPRLRSRQVAGLIAVFADDELEGPFERLLFAFGQSRKKNGEEWNDVRDATANAVGWLVAARDADASAKVRDKAKELLDRCHELNAEDYKAQREELEAAAQKLVGRVGPMDVLRRVVEHDLAELLSNPRLGAAVEARLKPVK